jgi:hypothetical protein
LISPGRFGDREDHRHYAPIVGRDRTREISGERGDSALARAIGTHECNHDFVGNDGVAYLTYQLLGRIRRQR